MSKELSISLYGMAEEMKTLESMLIADGGELTQEHEDLKSQIFTMIQTKTDGCVGYIQALEDDITLGKNKKKLLDEFMNVRKNTIERFKKYVAECLDQLETKKLTGQLGQISERKQTKIALIEDENKIPAEYTTVETVVTVNRKRILDDLKAGIEVPGAKLVDGNRSIQIKFKKVK